MLKGATRDVALFLQIHRSKKCLVSIANAICEVQTAEGSWDLIRGHRDVFFWTDDEDHVHTWNRLYGSVPGWNPVNKEWRNESLWLTSRNKTVQVLLRSDRVDRWINIHAIATLVGEECEFRFCKDSAHSSDQACLALSPKDWVALESKFGLECTQRRFLKINKDVDVFLDEAFPSPTEPIGRLDPGLTNWVGGSSYQPAKLNYVIVSQESGQVETGRLLRLVEQNLMPGLVGISTDTDLEMRWVDRSLLVETIAPLICDCTVRVVDSTSSGFLIIERVGVAAGWRTDDQVFLEKKEFVVHRRWWEFWKVL